MAVCFPTSLKSWILKDCLQAKRLWEEVILFSLNVSTTKYICILFDKACREFLFSFAKEEFKIKVKALALLVLSLIPSSVDHMDVPRETELCVQSEARQGLRETGRGAQHLRPGSHKMASTQVTEPERGK